MEGREGLADVIVNPYVVEEKMEKDSPRGNVWYFERKRIQKMVGNSWLQVLRSLEKWTSDIG